MTKIEELQLQIAQCSRQIKEIQAECSHPKSCLTKKHGADTGNWCPSDDSYWTDFHCSLCDKRWTEEGSK